MFRTWSLCTTYILILAIISCSDGGSGSPLVPSDQPGDPPELTANITQPNTDDSSHVLWGLWQGVLDLQAKEFELIPLRGAAFHLNLARILENTSGTLSVQVNSLNLPERLLDIDVTITHPVPNSDLRGFDVRGILMGPGETMTSQTDPWIIYNSPNGTRLLNADGYTRWWNAVEFTNPGIFGYDDNNVIPGFLVPETTLNPYKYFADPLGPNDPVVPGVNESNRGTFSTSPAPAAVTRNYLVRFPVIQGQPKLGFHYAIDASYAPPTGGSGTPKPIVDFPPNANCPEPYHIKVNTENSWVWYQDEQNNGGTLVLDIEVFDWNASVNPQGILGEISGISIESPTLCDPYTSWPVIPVQGSQPDSGIFQIIIPDVHPTGVDGQEVLVTVKSNTSWNYAPPNAGHDYPEQAYLAAYALVEVPVSVTEPSFVEITLETPNGGEYWTEGSMYEISWDAHPEIENVKILLSNDSGQEWSTPVAMSTPNDGSFFWFIDPSIEESNHCRIKITDVLPTGISDESEEDFVIFNEELAPIQVISPNGGEIWKAQTVKEITWKTDPDIPEVKIELTLNNGVDYPVLVAESTPNNGSLTWDPIPDSAVGEKCRIKISNADDPTVFDVSNAIFSIKPMGDSYIDIQTPVESDEWQIGCSEPVEWVWDGIIPEVNILFSVDSLGTWSTVAGDIINSGYEIVDFNPENISDLSLWESTELSGKVRVESSSDPGVFDEIGVTVPINLGILFNMVQESVAGDADSDNIPDDVEMFIGTDPTNRDSDIPNPDSFFDNYEIFGDGFFDPYDLIPDNDEDGVIAPLDMDDNSDGVNDGEEIDTDLDGIPNYLEYYGYTYDWMSGTYDLWDGENIHEPYFKTDPLQPSTDQDPYPDSMETSGAFMDVSVLEPGDYPMVPAYPNIIVRLEGYDVTLNQEITIDEGKSIEQGSQWSAETSREFAVGMELNWEVGVEGGFEIGKEPKITGSAHANLGGNVTATNTTAVTRSTGGSVATTTEWHRATVTNPIDAAHLRLYLKVYNQGTSCASNIVPTITLKIGSRNVTTFQPSTTLNLLPPGGTYPSQPATYWVVDTKDDGDPISLTLDDLRALECGAPVTCVITQMTAEVMLMNQSGQWESAGDWGEYMARCEAVCANMYLEIGNGQFLHYLVYADDSPSAPTVTFGDALIWVAGADADPSDTWITYKDEYGQEQTASLDGWDFCFDQQTLIANGFTGWPLAPPDPEYNLADLRLGPDTEFVGKIPREVLPDVEGPQVIYAYLDERHETVRVSAFDYNGIDRIEYTDKYGSVSEMPEYISGSGVYSLDIPGYVSHQTDGGGIQETVRVYSTNTTVTPTDCDVETVVYPTEITTVNPSINLVRLNLQDRTLTAEITCDLMFPITSVKVYHPTFPYGGVEMVKHEEWWNYPNRYIYQLPATITDNNYTDLTIAANTSGGGYDIHEVTISDYVKNWYAGSAEMEADMRFSELDFYVYITWREEYWSSRLDVDQDMAAPVKLYRDTGWWNWPFGLYGLIWYPEWDSYHTDGSEFWVRRYDPTDDSNQYTDKECWMVLFNYDWVQYTGPKSFETLTEADCASLVLNTVPPVPVPHDDFGTVPLCNMDCNNFYVGTLPAIFIMKTSEGRFTKFRITDAHHLWIQYPITPSWHRRSTVSVDYITFYKGSGLQVVDSGSDQNLHAGFNLTPSESFDWDTLDIDTGTDVGHNSVGFPWNNGWNPSAPVDFWFRYWDENSDPWPGGYAQSGYILFSNNLFKLIPGGVNINSLEETDFQYMTDTEFFVMVDDDSFTQDLTILTITDQGTYAAVTFTEGVTDNPDTEHWDGDLTYDWWTFEVIELD